MICPRCGQRFNVRPNRLVGVRGGGVEPLATEDLLVYVAHLLGHLVAPEKS